MPNMGPMPILYELSPFLDALLRVVVVFDFLGFSFRVGLFPGKTPPRSRFACDNVECTDVTRT